MTSTQTNKLPPTLLIIFGITGDLSQKYLLPALYHLEKFNLIPDKFLIVGLSRRQMTRGQVDALVQDSIKTKEEPADTKVFERLIRRLEMVQLDPEAAEDYQKLRQYFDTQEDKHKVCFNRLIYLAIPPKLFMPVIKQLGTNKINLSCRHDNGQSRILIEKPFGFDLTTAKELIKCTEDYFSEEQVFRIDHYLAKETAQNILTFRFNNPLLQSVWDKNSIDQIQITVSETLGVASRTRFYEQTGALRDVVQSHLMQLLALITMEEPANMEAKAIHKARQQLLSEVATIASGDVDKVAARGQYTGGDIDGQPAASYLEEINHPTSNTETYAALLLKINNSRWQGVPILLQTGKRLRERVSEISVIFKPRSPGAPTNVLVLRIVPNEGIALVLQAKKPGFKHDVQNVTMDFCYNRSFGERAPDAYERLLLDAVKGDQTLFPSGKEILESWRVIDALISVWQQTSNGLELYRAGSSRPKSADQLANRNGCEWLVHDHNICSV